PIVFETIFDPNVALHWHTGRFVPAICARNEPINAVVLQDSDEEPRSLSGDGGIGRLLGCNSSILGCVSSFAGDSPQTSRSDSQDDRKPRYPETGKLPPGSVIWAILGGVITSGILLWGMRK